MNIPLTSTNWSAVAGAAIVYSAFSGIWHRQFAFGKKWEEAMGFNRPEGWKETAIYYVVPSVSCLTTSTVLAILLELVNATTFQEALMLGLLTGIGFGAAITCTNAVIPIMKKPLVFGAITGSAHTIGIALATIVIYAMTK